MVVTGAAGGIGSAIARALAAAGARLVVTDLDQAGLDSVVTELDGDGHISVSANLNDEDARQGLIAAASSGQGSLYGLVHAAGVLRRRASIDEVTEDDWDLQLDTNLKASFFLSRLAANVMIPHHEGRVILFSSQGWMTGGFGGSTVYAASKGGVVSMSRGLARTYGPHGITVNTIAPGQIRTPMLMTDLDPAVYERMTADTPLGFVGEPEDIAGTAVFLASSHARYIS
ncbi:short-chain dehydrogenase/reductase SDR, partial [mine drainage metagenome]